MLIAIVIIGLTGKELSEFAVWVSWSEGQGVCSGAKPVPLFSHIYPTDINHSIIKRQGLGEGENKFRSSLWPTEI